MCDNLTNEDFLDVFLKPSACVLNIFLLSFIYCFSQSCTYIPANSWIFLLHMMIFILSLKQFPLWLFVIFHKLHSTKAFGNILCSHVETICL